MSVERPPCPTEPSPMPFRQRPHQSDSQPPSGCSWVASRPYESGYEGRSWVPRTAALFALDQLWSAECSICVMADRGPHRTLMPEGR